MFGLNTDDHSQKGKIPGYCGYVQSVKSENLFGRTYGAISYQVETNQITKGSDFDESLRYISTNQDHFSLQNLQKGKQCQNQAEVHLYNQIKFAQPQSKEQFGSSLSYDDVIRQLNE